MGAENDVQYLLPPEKKRKSHPSVSHTTPPYKSLAAGLTYIRALTVLELERAKCRQFKIFYTIIKYPSIMRRFFKFCKACTLLNRFVDETEFCVNERTNERSLLANEQKGLKWQATSRGRNP